MDVKQKVGEKKVKRKKSVQTREMTHEQTKYKERNYKAVKGIQV